MLVRVQHLVDLCRAVPDADVAERQGHSAFGDTCGWLADASPPQCVANCGLWGNKRECRNSSSCAWGENAARCTPSFRLHDMYPCVQNGYPLGEKATESTRRGSWSLAPCSARTSNQVVVGCTRTVRPTAKAPP